MKASVLEYDRENRQLDCNPLVDELKSVTFLFSNFVIASRIQLGQFFEGGYVNWGVSKLLAVQGICLDAM